MDICGLFDNIDVIYARAVSYYIRKKLKISQISNIDRIYLIWNLDEDWMKMVFDNSIWETEWIPLSNALSTINPNSLYRSWHRRNRGWICSEVTK